LYVYATGLIKPELVILWQFEKCSLSIVYEEFHFIGLMMENTEKDLNCT